MKNKTESEFLQELQEQAVFQAELEKHKILPQKVRGVARLVSKYPWQTFLLTSMLTSLLLTLFLR